MIKLSIIIPVYNCQEYTNELLDCLDNQITDEVQVIIVDDGSEIPFETKYEWPQIIHKENGGVSSARNAGLDNVKGKYVAYIDGDDLVSDDYISTIIEKIDKERFDYCYLSWKTLPNGWQCDVKLKTINDKFPSYNLCTWNRIYKFEKVKDIRFNELKKIAEDAEYIKLAEAKCIKKSFISEYMYYYRSDTPDSLTKRFAKGEVDTQRVVYFFPRITKDMEYLVDEVKKTNDFAEVIIMTNSNEIDELENYAMVTKPTQMKGTELRGEKTHLFQKINLPIKTQVVFFTDRTFAIGGIETFIYNFCQIMKEYYDITVVYNFMHKNQIERLEKDVRVIKNNVNNIINCDTVIVNRISDKVPKNINYKKKIQMVHCCKLRDEWEVPSDNDLIVPVSNVVKESFIDDIKGNKNKVIYNMTYNEKPKKVLRLVSGTRLTFEKGEERIIKLAQGLKENNIPFIWTIFSDKPLRKNIEGIYIMKPNLEIRDYIYSSDYLVQLSDSEAFCYSIVESLEMGTPVITTPIDVLDEIGVKDGENAIVVPYDMEDIDYERIANTKFNFNYEYKNDKSVSDWRKVLGNTTPLHDYVYHEEPLVVVKATKKYNDIEIGKLIYPGDKFSVKNSRAKELISARVVEIIS